MKEDSKIDLYTNKIVNKFKLKKLYLPQVKEKNNGEIFKKLLWMISGISNIDPFWTLFYKEYERKKL